MTVYRYHIKCLVCGVHYQVYSDHEKWELRPDRDYGFCPECGHNGPTGKIVWREVLEKTFIFHHVPGHAGMGTGTVYHIGALTS